MKKNNLEKAFYYLSKEHSELYDAGKENEKRAKAIREIIYLIEKIPA